MSPDGESGDAVLMASEAAQMRFGTAEPAVIRGPAAVGLCMRGWRATSLEDDHTDGRIAQNEMLAANAATTRVAFGWLDHEKLDPGWLADETVRSDRHLGSGLLVGDVLANPGEVREQMESASWFVAELDARHGRDAALAGAAMWSVFASHWWGMPWWPEAIAELVNSASTDGGDPPLPAARIQRLLTMWPDQCSPAVADWAIRGGLHDATQAANARWLDGRGPR